MAKEGSKKAKHNAQHSAQRKVFDVTRPGKAPASPNSRSVIASVKPPVADDQFVPSAPPLRASDPYAKHELMNPKTKKELRPLNDSHADSGAAVAQSAPVAGAPEVPSQTAPTSRLAAVAKNTSFQETAPPELQAPGGIQFNAPATAPLPAVSSLPTEFMQSGVSTMETAESPADQKAASAPSTPAAEPGGVETPTEEETPAHVALEQTVDIDNNNNVPIWEHPDTSQQVAGSAYQADDHSDTSKSIEDLLAETGAPDLELEQSPSLIVSHHDTNRGKGWKIFLVFLLIVVLALIALDLLLDAGVVTTGVGVPYTDFIR